MKRTILLVGVAVLLVHASSSSAATCKPGNGITYTCDFTCAMTECDMSTTAHATCNGWGDPADGKCVICGRTVAEVITGTDGADVICGSGGGDEIYGGEGDDILGGGGGNDTIEDLSGNNTVMGGNGADEITTGDGDDVLLGESGVDVLDAGGGSNQVHGGADDDTLVSTQASPLPEPCTSEHVVDLPSNFTATQGENDLRYGLDGFSELSELANCSSDLEKSDCGNTYSGAGCEDNFALESFVIRDETCDLLLLRPVDVLGAVLGEAIEYKAPAAGTYTAIGKFARASECEDSGDGVTVAVVASRDFANPLFEETIDSAHVVDPCDPFSGTGATSFEVTTFLESGDTLEFLVFSATNDQTNTITALEVDVVQGTVSLGPEVLGSRLCGGDGNDSLEAIGPGHQCLDGGGDGSDDECTYQYDGPLGSRDVGTARNCLTNNGPLSTSSPGCGCQ